MSPSGPEPDDLDTCLRVLAQARAADPADPRWEPVRQAAADLHKAGRKASLRARRAERRRQDLAALATATRYRDQNPSDTPPTEAHPHPAPNPPDTDATSTPASRAGVRAAGPELHVPRRCYVCKGLYRRVDADYHLLCRPCATENAARRVARCDLRGRRALVTGGRVRIGFQVALKLLRDGAEVLVTTRFPRDAARRFAAVPDCGDWLGRLHVHGVDLLDLPGVAGLLDAVHDRFDHLDILVNNAAQTIRRPPAYYREVATAERLPLTGRAAQVPVRDTAPASPDAARLPATDRSAGRLLDADRTEEWFPLGRLDETGQPLDLRARNSWNLLLHEVDPAEWMEVQLVNAFAPFLLTSRLRGLLAASPWPDRYVVQVSAMEGSFSRRNKTARHPHTNMAKASLNMLTRTSAEDYAAAGIFMNSVDTGWVTDERPYPVRQA